MRRECIFLSGTYYIGDPIFLIDEWDAFLGNLKPANINEFVFNFKGKTVAAGYTKYGDGIFNGTDFLVESGMLAIVPTGIVEEIPKNIEEYGMVIEMPESFIVIIEEGVFAFGDILIDTTKEEYNRVIQDDDEDDDFDPNFDPDDDYHGGENIW